MTPLLEIKKFTVEEYFKDYDYVTQSHLKYVKDCPYFYQQKKEGNVPHFDRDYFTYGHAVDTILSREKLEDKFFAGKEDNETEESMLEAISIIEKEIEVRSETGKTEIARKPLKTQQDKIAKLKERIRLYKENQGKEAITATVRENVIDTANEIMSQPLYKAFDTCQTQIIIGVEINGVKVKAMLDKISLENGIINDDKSTANMNTYDPEKNIQQLAWYRWIVRETFGVECDCYLSVGDKGATQTHIKRSSIYHITKSRLDYQEELNNEDLQEFIKIRESGIYLPCTEDPTKENAREKICFACDHYKECHHSRQKSFIVI